MCHTLVSDRFPLRLTFPIQFTTALYEVPFYHSLYIPANCLAKIWLFLYFTTLFNMYCLVFFSMMHRNHATDRVLSEADY